jgi:hypothetical protein
MLDIDLAELNQVETKRLNEKVKRNIGGFPEDFMFQLDNEEWELLRSQFATSKERRGGRRYAPRLLPSMALMLSSVLNSERAIQVNIQIMRIYSKLKGMIMDHKLEGKVSKHDETFQVVLITSESY